MYVTGVSRDATASASQDAPFPSRDAPRRSLMLVSIFRAVPSMRTLRGLRFDGLCGCPIWDLPFVPARYV
eukprot:1846255-Prymnesium_polylepis.1